MPEGEDPDDVFRKAGAAALAGLLGAARPAAAHLFERERAREPLNTPERKSSFKKRLREAAQRIVDEETRRLYLAELMARAEEALRPPPRPGAAPKGGHRRGGYQPPEPRPSAELKARQAGSKRHLAVETVLREAVDRPMLAERYADWLARLPIPDQDLLAIRDALLDLLEAGSAQAVDRAALSRHLRARTEERALARVASWPLAKTRAEDAAVEAEWTALVTLDVMTPALKEELAALRAGDLDQDAEAFERAWRIGSDALEDQKRRRSRSQNESSSPAEDEEAA
jgi:DNA primase